MRSSIRASRRPRHEPRCVRRSAPAPGGPRSLEPPADRRDSLWRAAWRSGNFAIGAIITAVFVLGALLSFVWTPYDFAAQNIPNKLKPPSAANWLGTDHFGRDMLSMILVGARTSIAV